jgi:DNA replication protein DnaC
MPSRSARVKSFSAWAEIFGDATAVEAMVGPLVRHAEVIVLQGESYGLKDRATEVVPPKSR